MIKISKSNNGFIKIKHSSMRTTEKYNYTSHMGGVGLGDKTLYCE